MKIHIIYLNENILLSKGSYENWQEIQEKYDGYKSSLGPWEIQDIREYLLDEYPDIYTNNKSDIENYLNNNQLELTL